MDPRIRIRIHPKMSWIRNTGLESESNYKYYIHEVSDDISSTQVLKYIIIFTIKAIKFEGSYLITGSLDNSVANPDPLVRGTDPHPDPSIIKHK
jgi:hypothetical protein